MATFEQRASGWWQAKIRRKGQPVQSQTFERRTDAEAWARDLENKMDRGVFTDRSEAESTTLLEALNRYERTVSTLKDGYAQEKYRINMWRADTLASRSLANLRSADFAMWRDDRLRSYSASTVRRDMSIISHVFTIAAKEWGMSVVNPIKNITLPKEDNARERRFEAGEADRILDELKPVKGRSIWMLPLVLLALETAARQSELLALKWSDVDLVKSFARIRGKDRADGKSRTKNGDKYRDVPLSIKAKSILSDMPRSIDGRVFPVTPDVAKQAFVRACARAGIKDFRFHDLRHEATSRLADKLALHELMKVTGHKDTRMLARYYHPRAEDLAKKLG